MDRPKKYKDVIELLNKDFPDGEKALDILLLELSKKETVPAKIIIILDAIARATTSTEAGSLVSDLHQAVIEEYGYITEEARFLNLLPKEPKTRGFLR